MASDIALDMASDTLIQPTIIDGSNKNKSANHAEISHKKHIIIKAIETIKAQTIYTEITALS